MTAQCRALMRMGYGFGIGSLLFAVGAVMATAEMNVAATNAVFSLGAICFTLAAGVQWLNAERTRTAQRLHDPDWVASGVQFIGTLSFNVMTLRALAMSFDPQNVTYSDVWVPDVFGSALFLISSWIAWHPIAREKRHHLIHGRSRLITVSNMLGSVFFGLSAWGAMLLPSGEFRSPFWNNAGTFVGAVFFLIASVALLPRRAEVRASAAAGRA